jgi:hypothetical protein
MNTLFLSMSWRDFLIDIKNSPQSYIFWLIVFLGVLFVISRLRNRMEVRGVNKAIYISRGLVGTFIAFIVTPIVLYIFLNIMALVHGVNLIDISFLTKWIGLTLTSYWWLLKCFFGSASISGALDIYSIDSIIRILWIILPFSFIWVRMSKTRISKLFLIPFIIGILVITRYKTCSPTFITEDKELMKRIPGLNWFVVKKHVGPKKAKKIITPAQRKLIAGGLAFMVLCGFVVGLYLEYRVIGLFVSLVGLLGFLLMAPHEKEKKVPKAHHAYHLNINNLVHRMDSLYRVDGESVDVYELSLKIGSAYHARMSQGDMIRFPDSLCAKYESYFYDWCKE